MDHREHSYYPQSIEQDHENQRLILWLDDEYVIVSAEYKVCPDCNGKGKYVNPSIDSHGLSSEDFADDPEFQEDYFSGKYDICCRSCNGRNVILVPITAKGKEQVESLRQEEHEYRMEVAAERRACGYY